MNETGDRPSTANEPTSAVPSLGKLGRYKLVSRLGKGGMAEVFLATQDGPAGFQKQVVIKRSDPDLAKNPRFVEMFLREARIAALFNHNNVVQVFELGQEGETYFIAMEHIDGISLHRAARQTWAMGESIPMEVIVKCVADAARGLHYAHHWKDAAGKVQGFVHRDVSPDNLMLTKDGVTKVLDFGIAKMAIDEGEPVTRTGEIKGKIPYMSPEQLKGEVLDGRADLWSLGVTLYWLLTGARPFAGGNEIATLQSVLHDAPPPLRSVNPLVPPALERLTLRLLEKDRTRRFGSGNEVADALMTLLGPGGSSNVCSEFAQRMLSLEHREPQAGRSQSVQTVVAAKPHSDWMKQGPVGDDTAARQQAWGQAWSSEGTAGTFPAVEPLSEPAGTTQAGAAVAPRGRGLRVGIAAGTALALVAAVAVVLLTRVEHQRPPPPVVALPPTTLPAPPPTTLPAPPPVEAPAVVAVEAITAPSEPGVDHPIDAPRARAKTRTVAPDSIRWESTKGKALGKGSAGIVVPEGNAVVVAVDPATGGRSTISVTPGRPLDYSALGKGRLSVRAQPWADVKLGAKVLGTTPFEPLALTAGEYVAVFNYEGKVIQKPFTITSGKETIVAVHMLK